MGLDFNLCDAHWSYSGFNRFRQKLARDIGIDLDEMVGFGGDIEWSTVKDPIKYLLNHSDCEGQIGPSRCKRIAPRLRNIVEDWNNVSDEYDKDHAIRLAEGMEKAVKFNKPLIFQ